MFLPAFAPELGSVPAIVFWAIPLTLPFWFGMCTAWAITRVQRGETISGWAIVHTTITVLGAGMLGLWVAVVWQNSDEIVEVGRWGGPVALLALLPASLKLFTARRAEWRLYRALTLNAIGCLIFAVQLLLMMVQGHGYVQYPGPALWLAIPSLIAIAIVARGRELATAEYDQPAASLPAARVA
jgi:hypothetical protein